MPLVVEVIEAEPEPQPAAHARLVVEIDLAPEDVGVVELAVDHRQGRPRLDEAAGSQRLRTA